MLYADYVREKMRNLKHSRLPKEYQEVKYIESTGTQYINTEYYPNLNTRYELDVQFIDLSYEQMNGIAGGVALGSSYIRMGIGITIGTRRYWAVANENIQKTTSDTYRHLCWIDFKNGTYGYDENVYYKSVPSFANPAPIHLFCRFGNNVYSSTIDCYCKEKLYGCKLYENEVLVRNMVPCYRKSDNVIGMYDLVNNKFYTNAGTGEFIKGGNV